MGRVKVLVPGRGPWWPHDGHKHRTSRYMAVSVCGFSPPIYSLEVIVGYIVASQFGHVRGR